MTAQSTSQFYFRSRPRIEKFYYTRDYSHIHIDGSRVVFKNNARCKRLFYVTCVEHLDGM